MKSMLWIPLLATALAAGGPQGGFSEPARPLPWETPDGEKDRQGLALTGCLDGTSFTSDLADCAAVVSEVIGLELLQCGLSLIDPYTPGLPYPQIPADRAITGARGELLAYLRVEYLCPGVMTDYRNPDGSHSHSIEVSENRLRFVTPFQGVVARMSRWKSVDGYHYSFYCLGRPVSNVNSFCHCVRTAFIDLVTGQLCRFGE